MGIGAGSVWIEEKEATRTAAVAMTRADARPGGRRGRRPAYGGHERRPVEPGLARSGMSAVSAASSARVRAASPARPHVELVLVVGPARTRPSAPRSRARGRRGPP